MGCPVQAPMVIYWVDEPAEIRIEDGVSICQIKSGDLLIELRCRPKVLVSSLVNGNRAFGKFVGQTVRPIVRFAKAKPTH
jgi:hypothetical protein